MYLIKTDLGLCKEQQYVLDIVRTVQTSPDKRVCTRTPQSPPMVDRLCANRVKGLFISQPSPSNELKILPKDIVKTYALVWFDTKKYDSNMTEIIFLRLYKQQVICPNTYWKL